ncbi:uncharacterized protein LOC114669739 [Macaca mulatta]|uniref:uncharacterized protein LOC114669739 n=1 Tax=Macaca mulatta TaxID=9544 RepID=UPI0007326DF6|nr:uncharacterized protein LOC114669739 [Macaca mulatta]XP_045240616.1 uncharacterized protein LOC123571643 [Macaca fascicularis]
MPWLTADADIAATDPSHPPRDLECASLDVSSLLHAEFGYSKKALTKSLGFLRTCTQLPNSRLQPRLLARRLAASTERGTAAAASPAGWRAATGRRKDTRPAWWESMGDVAFLRGEKVSLQSLETRWMEVSVSGTRRLLLRPGSARRLLGPARPLPTRCSQSCFTHLSWLPLPPLPPLPPQPSLEQQGPQPVGKT